MGLPLLSKGALVARTRRTTQFRGVPRAPSFRSIVEQFGGLAASRLGLALDAPDGRAGWLLAAALTTRSGEPDERAFLALADQGLARPEALAGCEPARLAGLLAGADRNTAERDALRLLRLARGLQERGGSLERLAGEAGDLTELGEALVRIAPGFGPAAVLRFLRPLRAHWPAAREVPLDPDARAAAVHLGWLLEGADEEGEPASLAAALADAPDPPPLEALEAALARLGRAACRRDRPDRCPLGDACPRRALASDPTSQ
jgi:hypothetical protein